MVIPLVFYTGLGHSHDNAHYCGGTGQDSAITPLGQQMSCRALLLFYFFIKRAENILPFFVWAPLVNTMSATIYKLDHGAVLGKRQSKIT